MAHIKSAIKFRERNIEIVGADLSTAGGFTQVPNFILRTDQLTPGEKLTYASLLSYAWNNEGCFPGQERLAQDMGVGRTTANGNIKNLENKGLLEVTRRGQGKTNYYRLHIRAPKQQTSSK